MKYRKDITEYIWNLLLDDNYTYPSNFLIVGK